MQHCFWCGEELGMGESRYGDIEACGKRECQRELMAAYREQEMDARARAEEDNYERYR